MNIYFIPTDLYATAEEVEKRYLHMIGRVRASVSLPVSVKLSPYFSSFGNMAWQVINEGVDGIVLFNRFYQPDFDIEKISVFSDLDLSVPNEIRLPLLWISLLYNKFKTSIGATSGVQGGKEAIKFLLAGADAVMMASALYRHGIEYISTMQREIESWMERHNFDSIDDFKGRLSQQNIMDTTAFERANYIKVLEGIRE
jgi:dihydroorotate dehydrogenase (fumarate)